MFFAIKISIRRYAQTLACVHHPPHNETGHAHILLGFPGTGEGEVRALLSLPCWPNHTQFLRTISTVTAKL